MGTYGGLKINTSTELRSRVDSGPVKGVCIASTSDWIAPDNKWMRPLIGRPITLFFRAVAIVHRQACGLMSVAMSTNEGCKHAITAMGEDYKLTGGLSQRGG